MILGSTSQGGRPGGLAAVRARCAEPLRPAMAAPLSRKLRRFIGSPRLVVAPRPKFTSPGERNQCCKKAEQASSRACCLAGQLQQEATCPERTFAVWRSRIAVRRENGGRTKTGQIKRAGSNAE